MPQLRSLLALSLLLVACKKEAPSVAPPAGSAGSGTPSAGSSTTPAIAPKPAADAITKEEAASFGAAFAKALAPCDGAAVDRLIDAKKFTARFDEKTRSQIGTFDKLGESLCSGLGADAAVRYVGVVEANGVLRPRIRTIVKGGVNFLEPTLARNPDKSVQAIDIFSLRNGEEMSQLLSLVGKLIAHGEAAARAYIDATQKTGQGDYAGAKQRFMEIPAEVRTKIKAIALQGLTIDVQGPTELYLASIAEFRKNFPNDPSVTLVEIDAHSLKKDYPRLNESLGVLLARTNNDPYVLVMRARGYVDAKDTAKAKVDLEAALAAEPEMWLAEAGEILLRLAVDEKRFADAVSYLDRMLNAEIDKAALHGVLTKDGAYKPLLASKEYKAWRGAPASPKAEVPPKPANAATDNAY